MTSRPLLLLFLLLLLILTSQFEWKHHIQADPNPPLPPTTHQLLSHQQQTLKEKIILSQEKSIQQLNELVQSLQLQLLHCRGNNNTILTSQNATNDDTTQLHDHHSLKH